MGLSVSAAPPMPRRSLPGHMPELDGLRGIAVLAVIAFHFTGAIPADANWFRALYGKATGLGFLGVGLFFVLSGFLITGILLRTKHSKNYLKSFYMRRVLRILPLYYLCVFLFFDVVFPLAKTYAASNNTVRAWVSACGPHEQVWYWLHLSNFRSAYGVMVSSPVGHFWSLACEEQFYFVWPWVVLFLSESALTKVCAAGLAGCIGFRFLPMYSAMLAHNPDIGRLTLFNVEPLLFGAMVAICSRHVRFGELAKRWSSLCVLVSCAGVILLMIYERSTDLSKPPLSSFGQTAIHLIFASAIAYGAFQCGSSSPGAVVLRNPFFTQCGKYSYAMYIFQTPIRYVLLIVPIRHRIASLGDFGASIASILIGVAASYGLARCSWKLVESPFLRLKDRFPAN